MAFTLPAPLRTFFSYFPLHQYPEITSPPKHEGVLPTLWILPPREDTELLSSDAECLKWQAYLALRGLSGISVRWDVSPDGGIDGRLPNLLIPSSKVKGNKGELLAAHLIPNWVDGRVESELDALEGYKDDASRDESRAWVSLLEGNVHAALVLAQMSTQNQLSHLFLTSNTAQSLQTLLSPPPAPLSGITSVIPVYGTRAPALAVEIQYREAIKSLSERLGADRWFLGSQNPTALDALVFAYLHTLLHSQDSLRIEVTRRVNLVAWEWRVRSEVRSAFKH